MTEELGCAVPVGVPAARLLFFLELLLPGDGVGLELPGVDDVVASVLGGGEGPAGASVDLDTEYWLLSPIPRL